MKILQLFKHNIFKKINILLDPKVLSITAVIISILGIYFQFFYTKHEIHYAILDSKLNKENLLLTPIFFKNSGNQTEIVLNAYLQLEFYSKEKIIEKRISEIDLPDFPMIFSPGDTKNIILRGDLQDYMFGMYEISIEDPSNFLYMPVTVFENLKLSLVVTYLSKQGKYGEEIRNIGYVTFDKKNEKVQSIKYDPTILKKLNLNKDKDILFHTFIPIEGGGSFSIDLNDTASVRKNYDKIQLFKKIHSLSGNK
jgi:hypothetical protein